jgi:hypothetical protein
MEPPIDTDFVIENGVINSAYAKGRDNKAAFNAF